MAHAVLVHARMTRRLLLAAALIAASASSASAGAYVGLGIGTAPAVDYGPVMDASDGRSGRLLVGTRFGRLAIEGSGGRFGLFLDNRTYDATTLAAALKYSLPLGDNFEVYGRGGVHRTWLTTGVTENADAAGNGWLAAAGFEYRFNLAVTSLSAFVDYQYARAGFTNDRMTDRDGSFRMWTLGLTLGL